MSTLSPHSVPLVLHQVWEARPILMAPLVPMVPPVLTVLLLLRTLMETLMETLTVPLPPTLTAQPLHIAGMGGLRLYRNRVGTPLGRLHLARLLLTIAIIQASRSRRGASVLSIPSGGNFR